MTADSSPPLLRLEHVAMQFPDVEGGRPRVVLRDVNLQAATGESLAVVGPSGCGKSTLLNIIGTLDRPTTGHVLLDNADLSTLNDKQLAAVRNRQIGFIFQDHHLLPQCTVIENVLVPTMADRRTDPAAARRRATDLLDRVGLADHLHHRPGQLSGGQRQRVAVVRALINEPKLLLADEPTGALDRASAEALADLLTGLNRERGLTMILVTHAPDLAAKMGRVMELRDGGLQPLQLTRG